MPGSTLGDAREQCHHAVQVNTHLARGFVAAQEDDSHTSLSWNADEGALVGQAVSGFRLGLKIPDLTLVWFGAQNATFSLDGKTFDEAMQWMEGQLIAAGFDPAPLRNPLHFTLETQLGPFRRTGLEAELAELANWYGNAALCLSRLAPTVRCWPHHFDLAVQVPVERNSLGVGMSPGDASYAQPYFYITCWPYPPVDHLPALELGHWHSTGWTGAVLLAEELLTSPEQEKLAQRFMDDAIRFLSAAS